MLRQLRDRLDTLVSVGLEGGIDAGATVGGSTGVEGIGLWTPARNAQVVGRPNGGLARGCTLGERPPGIPPGAERRRKQQYREKWLEQREAARPRARTIRAVWPRSSAQEQVLTRAANG